MEVNNIFFKTVSGCQIVTYKYLKEVYDRSDQNTKLIIDNIIPDYSNILLYGNPKDIKEYNLSNICLYRSKKYRKHNMTLGDTLKLSIRYYGLDTLKFVFTDKNLTIWLNIIDHSTEIDNKKVYDEPICPMCYEEFSKTNYCFTECGHKFCLHCFGLLVKNNKEKCPICEAQLFKDKELIQNIINEGVIVTERDPTKAQIVCVAVTIVLISPILFGLFLVASPFTIFYMIFKKIPENDMINDSMDNIVYKLPEYTSDEILSSMEQGIPISQLKENKLVVNHV